MAKHNNTFSIISILLVLSGVSAHGSVSSVGFQHIVGDSVWTVPPYNDFYTNWSSSYYFQTGDSLYFDFETDFQNVMQVSRREYENCSADQAFQAFREGPATVPLIEQGVFYYICSVPEHCSLGQKVNVTVNALFQYSPSPAPSPTSSSQPPTTPAMSPYASQAPKAMEFSISLLSLTSSCDAYHGGVVFGWFASMCFSLYISFGFF